MYDVVCVGIHVADVIVKTVDNLPENGKLAPVSQLELYTGGCATNSAIDLAKLGLNAAVIGKIGMDGFGNFIYDTLKKEGVNVDGLVRDRNGSTSASVVLVDSSGERSFLHCMGTNAEFTKDDIDYQIISDSKIVFIAGSFLMPGFDGEPCSEVLKKAKEMGRITALDTAWDASGKWMNVLRPCMEYIDIFIPSYEEAVQLSKQTEPEKIADTFLDMGVRTSVIKLGKDGCFIKNNEGRKHLVPTYKHIKPVDTTGAGDSFVAGFLTGVSKGWDLLECGRLANAVGTHCIMAVGASTGIKKLEDTMDFIGKNSAV